MLDLDAIISKSYQIKINGDLINVNQPSVKMVREFNSSMMNDSEDIDIFAIQTDFALKLLNNNTSAKRFTKADIEKLPAEALGAIINVVANGVEEAEKNPN